jgi:glycerophosphoryl diester phosphodiesterase
MPVTGFPDLPTGGGGANYSARVPARVSEGGPVSRTSSSTQIPTHARRGLLAVLLALVVGALTVLASPADAAGLYLHKGSRGASVQTLELRLAKVAGLPRWAVDRRYRANTVRAVKRFQVARHLRATGTVNQRTWDLVASAYVYATTWHPPTWSPPVVAAHRGGGPEAGIPENTLASLQYGAARGARILEFDLQPTSDGVLVLMHNNTLNGTTTCTGYVADRTAEDLRTNCVTKNGAQQIPTFDEVAQWVQSQPGVEIAPEIKDPTTDLSAFDAVVKAHDLSSRTYVQAFYGDLNADKSRRFDVDIFRDLLTLDPALRPIYLSVNPVPASTISASGAAIAAIGIPALRASDVAAYHAAKLELWGWTVRSKGEMQNAWSLHFDKIITDDPAAALVLYRR